eukprot:jgi/Orpsp1_1/1184187/evm.model.c7180000088389.1
MHFSNKNDILLEKNIFEDNEFYHMKNLDNEKLIKNEIKPRSYNSLNQNEENNESDKITESKFFIDNKIMNSNIHWLGNNNYINENERKKSVMNKININDLVS